MAIARVTANDAVATSTSASVTVSLPQTAVAGRLLIADVYANKAPSAIAISGWTKVDEAGINGSAQGVATFWKIAAGNETSVTATRATATIMRIAFAEYSGNHASPFDTSSKRENSGSAQSFSSSSLTTTTIGELIHVAYGFDGSVVTATFANQFNQVAFNTRVVTADRVVNSKTDYTTACQWTDAPRHAGVVVSAFKPAAASFTQGAGAVPIAAKRPDVVIILADDARFDDFDIAMPNASDLIRDNGVEFINAHTMTSQCASSRASWLTGLETMDHGVWVTDNSPGMDSEQLDYSDTLLAWMSDAGYRCGAFGKFMNRFEEYHDTDKLVPRGIDRCTMLMETGYEDSQGSPWTYRSENGNTDNGVGYSTDFFAAEAVDFIASTNPETPLFAYITPFAPHGPADPSSAHAGFFAAQSFAPGTDPTYNQKDTLDPGYVQGAAAGNTAALTAEYRDRLETLLSVDDLVVDVVEALEAAGRLDNTLIIVSSDNGYLLGEHRVTAGKVAPYTPSTRVPLWVRWDARGWSGQTDALVGANLDLNQTICDVAGLVRQTSGVSIIPVMDDGDPGRASLPLMAFGPQGGSDVPSFIGARTPIAWYVRYTDGFEESYDLTTPEGLESDEVTNTQDNTLRTLAESLCTPRPPSYVG